MDSGGRGLQAGPPIGKAKEVPEPASGGFRALLNAARLWRNRQIASPRFRARIARLPLLRMIANRKANQLFRLTTGFVHTQILSACVRLGVFDVLDGQVLTTAAVAVRCGLGPDPMRRLLDQARRLDLVVKAGPDHWMLSDAGTVLAADRGLREMIRHHDMLYRDLTDASTFWRGDLGETELRQYWAYVRGDKPAEIGNSEAAPYSALMRESQAMLADCILSSHDFGQYRSVLDIGGGEGAFLSALGEAHPSLQLALFDLPAVTRLASHHLRSRGFADRCTSHPGDFTKDPVPSEHDCVTLIRILCDHDDDRVLKILGNLHRHLGPGTRLVVAEAMAGPSEGANLAAIYFTAYFTAMGSGRCRTEAEIMDLLTRSGFSQARAVKTTNQLLAGVIIASR